MHDLDRPDVNGVPPKMKDVADQIRAAIHAPYLSVTTNDNLMSSVLIRGSFDARETWINNIFHNSRYFIIHVQPANGRYYDQGEPVTVELSARGQGVAQLRKYTGPVDKVVEKIKKFIGA